MSAGEPRGSQTANSSWHLGQSREVSFWTRYIRSHGGEHWRRLNESVELSWTFRPYTDLPPVPPKRSAQRPPLRFLVVGSGPGSDVGYKSWTDAATSLVLTDPLAKKYEPIFQTIGKHPPVRILPVRGEDLESHFGSSTFDFAYSVNAIDHTTNPSHVLRNMVRVVAPCRWAVVEVWENEATLQKGNGMHRWNIRAEEGINGASGMSTFVQQFGEPGGGLNVTEALLSTEASEFVTQRWQGCYLNGECAIPSRWRIRMSVGGKCGAAPLAVRAHVRCNSCVQCRAKWNSQSKWKPGDGDAWFNCEFGR
ncbi:hypothetical protein AB1Y20_021253 [Prymnesium parvum]|uniref:Methyltransferase type 11 domain-containing protein n=1 Tax=Prymnesium parvum TaxID=97485 RepID=A0AB34JI82_PRYPA